MADTATEQRYLTPEDVEIADSAAAIEFQLDPDRCPPPPNPLCTPGLWVTPLRAMGAAEFVEAVRYYVGKNDVDRSYDGMNEALGQVMAKEPTIAELYCKRYGDKWWEQRL